MGEFLMWLVLGVILAVVLLGLGVLFSIPEVSIFNSAYHTNYTAWDWLFGEDVIKDYIGVGKVERLNVGLEIQ